MSLEILYLFFAAREKLSVFQRRGEKGNSPESAFSFKKNGKRENDVEGYNSRGKV